MRVGLPCHAATMYPTAQPPKFIPCPSLSPASKMLRICNIDILKQMEQILLMMRCNFTKKDYREFVFLILSKNASDELG